MIRAFVFLGCLAIGLALTGQPRLALGVALIANALFVTSLIHLNRSHRR